MKQMEFDELMIAENSETNQNESGNQSPSLSFFSSFALTYPMG